MVDLEYSKTGKNRRQSRFFGESHDTSAIKVSPWSCPSDSDINSVYDDAPTENDEMSCHDSTNDSIHSERIFFDDSEDDSIFEKPDLYLVSAHTKTEQCIQDLENKVDALDWRNLIAKHKAYARKFLFEGENAFEDDQIRKPSSYKKAALSSHHKNSMFKKYNDLDDPDLMDAALNGAPRPSPRSSRGSRDAL